MTHEEFVKLARRYEKDYASDPVAFRRKLIGLLILGRGFVYLVLVLCLGVAFAICWHIGSSNGFHGMEIKLLIVDVLFIISILLSLWKRFPPPDGLFITRSECPKLFDMVDGLSELQQAPKFSKILISISFNASCSQRPRFGGFGGYENVLTIGLPLLISLPPEELKAVVAHEFGHFSANHGKFGAWIYRVSSTLVNMIDDEKEATGLYSIFHKFNGWFLPKLHAMTFPVCREQEYQADRAAAEATTVNTFGSTLMRINILGRHLESALDKHIEMKMLASPVPENLISGVCQIAAEPIPENKQLKMYSYALNETTEYSDTHPSLTDRLTGIGYHLPAIDLESGLVNEAPLPPVIESSADKYVGAYLPTLISDLDTHYASALLPIWQAKYKEGQEMISIVNELIPKINAGEFTDSEADTVLNLGASICPLEHVGKLADNILSKRPDHLVAIFCKGWSLIQEDDENGIQYLHKAAKLDPSYSISSVKLELDFYKRVGRTADAAAIEPEFHKIIDVEDILSNLREKLSKTDQFMPHSLSADNLHRLSEICAQDARILQVSIVRKIIPNRPNEVHHVFLLKVKCPFGKNMNEIFDAVLQGLYEKANFVYMDLMVMGCKVNNWFVKTCNNINGSLVYSATKR